MEEVVEKKDFLSDLKKDKFILALIILIFVLGVYVRFLHYGEEGYWNDDMTTVPTGLLWFYPHDYYPGLAGQGEPALGNYFVGLGCKLSGEDFSGISQIKPMFFPGRELLIGEAMTKADKYCHLPMYVFGLLFFITVSILALVLLDKYAATYAIAFFAFFPFLLYLSRWIHVDIISHVFLTLGLLFLWMFYASKKYSVRETLFFSFSAFFLALAFATKFPMAAFFVFAVFILFEKYKDESLGLLKSIFVKIDLKQFAEKIVVNAPNYKALIKNLTIGVIVYVAALFPPFEFNLKNMWLVLNKYRTVYPEMGGLLKINKYFFTVIYDFFQNINVIDLILFFFSLYLLFRLLLKKNKILKEKFVAYLSLFGFLCLLIFPSLSLLRVFFAFLIGTIFLMGLTFSNLFNINKRRSFFIFFILIYIGYSFFIALSTSPYFTYVNDAICLSNPYKCESFKSSRLSYFSSKVIVSYLSPILKEGETFYGPGPIINFYIKRSQHYTSWQFDTAFKQQVGRDPTISDRIEYFHPNNESIRYLFLTPYFNNLGKETETFRNKYEPSNVIRIKDHDIYYVYDLKNLKEKT